VRQAFTHNATFTNSGDHGGRTEYSVRLASQAFVDQLLTSVRTAAAGDRSIAGLLDHLPRRVTAIPAAQRTVFQIWVKDDKVEEIDIDLNQFAHTVPFALPLRIVIGAGTPVTAPSGATAVDLGRALRGLLTDNASSVSGTCCSLVVPGAEVVPSLPAGQSAPSLTTPGS
jgi:hypothetical protein